MSSMDALAVLGMRDAVKQPGLNVTIYYVPFSTTADSTTEESAYNSQVNVIKVTDERNNSTTFSFDALNRETGTTDALGDITTYVYNSDGDLTENEEPTPAGQTARTTIYTYNSMNELTVSTDPLGSATTYGYDADGNQVTVRDPMNRVTTTEFDALDRPIVVIDPMGNATTTTYDADDEVVQTVDPMGRITTATFSVRGWVPTVTDPLDLTTTYTYNSTGQTTSEAQQSAGDDGPEYTSTSYNADEELIGESDALGDFTTYNYDGMGNMIGTTDPNGNTTTYSYDDTNELTTVTNALGIATVYGYDASGNQITVTDGLGHTATTLYDAIDRATTMISATGGITTITYDAAGRETSLTDPDGNKTQWAYDADDRLTTVTELNGHTIIYSYNNDAEVVDTTDADGRRTTYSYNADGDQIGETWVGASPAEKITYTYDADNEMTGASDSFATVTFTYTADGQVQTAGTTGPGSGQPSVLLSYTYDPAGSKTSITDNLSSAGITAYGYNAVEEVTAVATSYGSTAGPQVAIGYDSGGRLTSADRTIGGSGTSVSTTFSYDAANRETGINDQVTTYSSGGTSGGSTAPLATYVYGYDSANRVTTEVDAEGTYTYTYDKANELTGVDENGAPVGTYSYDLNGNRTGTGYSTTVMNETATSLGITYTYDNAGNMISAKNGTTTTTYTYDFDNRLTEVTQNGTIIATYVYDALNRRIGIDDNGTQTWTVYDGTNPYADFSGSGTLEERYMSGPGVVNGAIVDQLLARTSSSGTTAWYLTDKLGSVRDIVSSSGTELDHIVYDSFGDIVTQTDAANGDRFKFAGMEYDASTGQYYDKARYYDPATGTFMGQDPTGFASGDENLERYVGNNPTDFVDPTGLSGGGDDPGAQAAQAAKQQAETVAQTMDRIMREVEASAAVSVTVKQMLANMVAQRNTHITQQQTTILTIQNLAIKVKNMEAAAQQGKNIGAKMLTNQSEISQANQAILIDQYRLQATLTRQLSNDMKAEVKAVEGIQMIANISVYVKAKLTQNNMFALLTREIEYNNAKSAGAAASMGEVAASQEAETNQINAKNAADMKQNAANQAAQAKAQAAEQQQQNPGQPKPPGAGNP
jgi:RHS repeat-associated protein